MSADTIFFIIAFLLSLAYQDAGWLIAFALILIADAINMKGKVE